MFPKKNRADKKLVGRIFKEGIFVNSNFLNLKYILDENIISAKVSFIVPKTIEKKAVKRNYLKRQGYVILKKYFKKIPNNFVGAFIFKKNITVIEIENEIKKILNKIN
jgi:ribonuclease P protein component